MSRDVTDGSGASARRVALDVLARVEDEGAYSNLVIRHVLDRSGLSDRDRGFVTDLVYGTLRRRRSCDHLVDRFLTSDPPPTARRALRIGAYQVAFRSDVPGYAAVSATVEATPRRFRGLVNAVLRKVASAPVEFPDDGTRLSYPDWIVDLLITDLGRETAVAALEQMNLPATASSRPDGYTQDLGSQWVVDLVNAQPGELVVDLCAAPGGKATGMAVSGATVVAGDLRPHRVDLISANADRFGGGRVLPLVADALVPPLRNGVVDRVLLDAPCSGLGVLRRRPDARWRLDPADVDRLADLQKNLLTASISLLKPGGVLAYSVCTLSERETIGVDRYAAEMHPELTPMDPPGNPWEPWGRGAILLPQARSTDGMCVFHYRYSP